MIHYYYKSLRTQNVEEVGGFRKGVWIHAENPSHDELVLLAEEYKLDMGLLSDALDEDEMPRLESDNGLTYIYVRAPRARKHGSFDTFPLLFIFAENCLITVSAQKFEGLEYITQPSSLHIATTQRTKLFLQIMQSLVAQYDQYIRQTSKQIKAIRARLRGHEIDNKDFIDFVTIEDELNEFLSALLPNNATLRRLSIGKQIPLYEEDKDIVDDLLLSAEQSIEASRSNIKSIVNIRQAYTAISSNNLNRTIKILTIVTVIISLPNTIFGMYGMNVKLPGQDFLWAYPLIISSVLLILLLMIAWLRKRKVI